MIDYKTSNQYPVQKEYTPQVIVARGVKNFLLSKVKGSVHTYIKDDTLSITITSEHRIVFGYKWYNLTSEIVHGVTSETIAQEVYKRYTHFIRNLFFL